MVAAKDEKEKKEGLVLVNTRLLALVTNHDSIEANPEKLEAAAAVSSGGRTGAPGGGGEKDTWGVAWEEGGIGILGIPLGCFCPGS